MRGLSTIFIWIYFDTFCINMINSFPVHICPLILRGMRSFSIDKYVVRKGVTLSSQLFDLMSLEIYDVDRTLKNVTYLSIGQQHHFSLPPVIIIGGTAQTIKTYSQHFRAFSRNRQLIIPELRGQGSTTLSAQWGTIDRHCDDIAQIMEALGVIRADFVGFSFGGRVTVALAAKYPQLVRKLSVTGVPLIRPALGKVILNSWKDGLANGQLRMVALSFLINGYSESFFERIENKLELFVEMITSTNDPENLYHLIDKSCCDRNPEYSMEACAALIKCPVQVIGGTEDRIAGFFPVRDFAEKISESEFHPIRSGHLVPFEEPILWRNLVLAFINDTNNVPV